jgi:hypothetical protein
MIDLDAWVDAVNPTEGAEWTLSFAYGINDSRLITGYGTYNDGSGPVFRAYLLDASVLPEPSTLSLLAVGGVMLLRRRK